MDTSARAVRLLIIAAGCDLAFLAVSFARGPASLVSQEFRTLPVQEELFEKVENMSIIQVTAPAISFDGALFDDDPEFLAEIVNLFLETYPQLLASIEETISKKDAPGLCRAAHTMKGAVANFGAKAVVEQAKAVQWTVQIA